MAPGQEVPAIFYFDEPIEVGTTVGIKDPDATDFYAIAVVGEILEPTLVRVEGQYKPSFLLGPDYIEHLARLACRALDSHTVRPRLDEVTMQDLALELLSMIKQYDEANMFSYVGTPIVRKLE